MSELIVIGHDSAEKAEAARLAVFGMAREYLVDVTDAVVATVDDKGKIRLNQMVDLWSVGASGGAFWGLLAGMLFWQPLVGVVLGATAGAVSGALTDYGINDGFMREITATLSPGKAALFLLVKSTASDRMIERLSASGGTILRTNLDQGAEDHLRKTFAEAHAEAARSAAEAPVASPEPAL